MPFFRKKGWFCQNLFKFFRFRSIEGVKFEAKSLLRGWILNHDWNVFRGIFQNGCLCMFIFTYLSGPLEVTICILKIYNLLEKWDEIKITVIKTNAPMKLFPTLRMDISYVKAACKCVRGLDLQETTPAWIVQICRFVITSHFIFEVEYGLYTFRAI